MKFAATFAAALLLSGGAAQAQTVADPVEWRRTDMSPQLPGATAFTAETDGVRLATVVIRAPVDRTMSDGSSRTFRGVVMRTEIRCAERRWKILSSTYYAADYSLVAAVGEFPDAPLVRQTPLHSAVTDVCDGGHTGPVALTTDDPVKVQRWLDSL